jgi:murein DD-endopeptidase MepM/ murein hydrolase activator NlpD
MRSSCLGRVRLLVFVLCAFSAVAVGASIAANTSEDSTRLSDRLDELAAEKARLQRNLRAVKESERKISRQLLQLDASVSQAEARLDRVSNSMSSTRADLETAEVQCEAAESQLSEQTTRVSDRLLAIYQRHEARPIEVLLGSSSFGDFTNRLYLLNQVVDRDAEILEEYGDARAQAESWREELEVRCRELADLQAKIAKEKRRTASKRRSAEREKESILKDRAAWERALAEKEQDSREIETMLQRRQHTPEGRDRPAKPWDGKFVMPVNGRVTSRYGYRRHPIYKVRKLHTGLDIAAPHGTPIRSAGDGTVVDARRWGGYGNCIVIGHGSELATLYGHCSRLAVTKGQKVTQGQVIGYVGSTGLSTGPHLHFEVRKDGRPTNPKPYM